MKLFLKLKYSWYAVLNILLYIKKNTIKYYRSFFSPGAIDYFAYHIVHPDENMVSLYKNYKEEEKKEKRRTTKTSENVERSGE